MKSGVMCACKCSENEAGRAESATPIHHTNKPSLSVTGNFSQICVGFTGSPVRSIYAHFIDFPVYQVDLTAQPYWQFQSSLLPMSYNASERAVI